LLPQQRKNMIVFCGGVYTAKYTYRSAAAGSFSLGTERSCAAAGCGLMQKNPPLPAVPLR